MLNSYLVNIDTAVSKVGTEPFQCMYKFSAPHRKVSCVALRNAQIPVGFYNVRAPYNTITICKAVSTVEDTLTLNGTPYTVPPNVYTLDTLINVLNGLISAVGSFSVVNGFVVLTTNSSVTLTVTGAAKDLWKLLGFVTGQSGTTIIAVNVPQLTFTIGAASYPVSPNNYTVATLITAVNTAISGVGTLALESTNGLITLTAGTTRVISCPTPDLSFLLGFSHGQSGTSILASRPAIASFDTYIRIHIENLNVPSTETNPCTFKIPVTYGNDKLILWNELSQNAQQNVVLATSSHIDRLNINVYDRFGGLLTNRGLDWSMTLEFVSNN